MKRKPFLIATFIAIAVAVLVRIVQLRYTIDPSTGFPFEKYNTIVTILSIATVVLSVGIVVFGKKTVKLKRGYRISSGFIHVGIGSVIMAVALFVTGFKYFASNPEYVTDMRFISYTIAYLLDIVVGVLFSIMAAFCFFRKKMLPSVALCVSLWSAVRLVLYYINFNGITANGENVLNFLAYATGMVFWLFCAMSISGYNLSSSVGWTYAFGGVAALFCALMMLPRIALTDLNMGQFLNNSSTASLIDIATLVFIILYLVKPVRKSHKRVRRESEEEVVEITNENIEEFDVLGEEDTDTDSDNTNQ